MGPPRNDGLLARVNFPLYSVEMLTSRHVLVAGGGGQARTGVANGFVSILFTNCTISCMKPARLNRLSNQNKSIERIERKKNIE